MSNVSQNAAELCGRVAELNSRYGPPSEDLEKGVSPLSAAAIIAALEQFMECVRYLNTRRSEATLRLDSEATVQDAVYLLLRATVHDLTPESPTDRIASRYTIKDFRSLTARCIIEAKYIRDRDHGRHVSREIHDDIETYRHDLACDTIVFFVYDPNVYIPDRAALQRQVEIERAYGGRPLRCRLIVKP